MKTNNVKGFVGAFSSPQYVYCGNQVVSSTRNQTYDQYIKDEKLWGGSRVAMHNSHPWEFMKNFAISGKNRYFDVFFYRRPWNREFNNKLSKIQDDMSFQSRAKNYVRGPETDLINDLKFYQFETLPLESLKFLDKFIVQSMKLEGISCNVIVFTIRGKITDKVWTEFSRDNSTFAKEYTMTHSSM